jgi:hypothetical protein
MWAGVRQYWDSEMSEEYTSAQLASPQKGGFIPYRPTATDKLRLRSAAEEILSTALLDENAKRKRAEGKLISAMSLIEALQEELVEYRKQDDLRKQAEQERAKRDAALMDRISRNVACSRKGGFDVARAIANVGKATSGLGTPLFDRYY